MRALLSIVLLTASAALADDVTLTTSTGAIHGTLVVPAAPRPLPVALIIAGSGPTDRDGNSAVLPGRNDSLRMLADALAKRGIASLRYDKRGVAASANAIVSESELRFETYVDDAVQWLRLLDADERFSSLVVIGHSEGSLIGILAAQQVPVAKVVSIAGPGRRASDVLLEQLERQLSGPLLDASRAIITALLAGNTYPNPPPELDALFRPSVQPYLISWFRYDPAAEARKLHVPLLVAQGTTDVQVSVDDATRLAGSSAKLLVIDGMNHVMKDVPADPDAQTRSYSDPSLAIDNTLTNAVAGFVVPVTKRRAR